MWNGGPFRSSPGQPERALFVLRAIQQAPKADQKKSNETAVRSKGPKADPKKSEITAFRSKGFLT